MTDSLPEELSKVKCPGCGNEFCIDVTSCIPDEQRTTMRLTSASAFLSAETIGRAIVLQSKVLRAVAKQHGVKVDVFVCGMNCTPGVVDLEFTITVIERQKP